jgi:hypothetical protein
METLSGRLKWEPTATGIRVLIPPRRWQVFFLILLIPFLTFSAFEAIQNSNPEFDPAANTFHLIFLLVIAVGLLNGAGYIFWLLAGVTEVELEPTRLEIFWRVGGFQLRTWTYRPDEIHNLHFEPRNPWAFRQSRKYSAIQFEARERTRRFASEIKAADANAMIRKMLEVCPISATLYKEDGPSEPGKLLDSSYGPFGKL